MRTVMTAASANELHYIHEYRYAGEDVWAHLVRAHVQKCVDRGKDINLTAAVNKDTITRGLRYSIATGNWGMQGTAGLRAGVSQVSLNLKQIFSFCLIHAYLCRLIASKMNCVNSRVSSAFQWLERE